MVTSNQALIKGLCGVTLVASRNLALLRFIHRAKMSTLAQIGTEIRLTRGGARPGASPAMHGTYGPFAAPPFNMPRL
jgi:hypothetical protein